MRPMSDLVQTQKRYMRLHEYQASQLVHRYMIPIPHSMVAFNSKEAYFIARKLAYDRDAANKASKFVIKAQVQAPARTKGVFKENGFKSGIHIVDTIDEVRDVSESMCGKHLVLPTSTEQGYLVNCVLVMEHIVADSNFLVSIRYDRAKQCPVIIYSKDGGLTLEKIRKKDPNSIK